MVALTAGCTGSPKNDKGTGPGHAIQPSDTLHTKQVAMNIYVSNRFRQQFGMSPSDYRREASERL